MISEEYFLQVAISKANTSHTLYMESADEDDEKAQHGMLQDSSQTPHEEQGNQLARDKLEDRFSWT